MKRRNLELKNDFIRWMLSNFFYSSTAKALEGIWDQIIAALAAALKEGKCFRLGPIGFFEVVDKGEYRAVKFRVSKQFRRF